MADDRSGVNPPNGGCGDKVEHVRISTKFLSFIDQHPRAGWYVAAWATLVTADAVVGIVDRLL